MNSQAEPLTSIRSKGIDFLDARRANIDLAKLSSLDKKTIVSAGYATIYFVGFEGDRDGDPVKVGWSRKAFERVRSFSTYSPKPIAVHEVLYIRSFMDKATERLCASAMKAGEDGFVADHLNIFRSDGADVAHIEKLIHEALTKAGRHHSREWFLGPVADLVRIARHTIEAEFDVPAYPHVSMLRMLKTWKKEAGLL